MLAKTRPTLSSYNAVLLHLQLLIHLSTWSKCLQPHENDELSTVSSVSDSCPSSSTSNSCTMSSSSSTTSTSTTQGNDSLQTKSIATQPSTEPRQQECAPVDQVPLTLNKSVALQRRSTTAKPNPVRPRPSSSEIVSSKTVVTRRQHTRSSHKGRCQN